MRGLENIAHCGFWMLFKTRPEDALGLEEAKTMELNLTHGFNTARGGVDNNPKDHTPPVWWLEEESSDQK